MFRNCQETWLFHIKAISSNHISQFVIISLIFLIMENSGHLKVASTRDVSPLNYSISHALGKGAFSTVFHAFHYPTWKTIALKRINMSELKPHYHTLCANEVKLLSAVDSANVIKCFEAFFEGNYLYMSLEYMDRNDLEVEINRLREQGSMFSERVVWYYFHQICNGLKDLHAKKILHRDLKPANVFLSTAGVAKLGDLGLSKEIASFSAQAKTRIGTEYYLAPERNEEHGYSFKSDVWSLGCLLYEMCTFRSPFNGEKSNSFSLHKRIVEGRYPPIPSGLYSRLIHHFIQSCMSLDADHRPTAVECHDAAHKSHSHFESMVYQYQLRSSRKRTA